MLFLVFVMSSLIGMVMGVYSRKRPWYEHGITSLMTVFVVERLFFDSTAPDLTMLITTLGCLCAGFALGYWLRYKVFPYD
ncbi:hypothetical protein ACFOEE_12865 [Pseudoalteromonas fenneropenaei]|uniref:Uncharacterized protein n=1 Tax=Pseudoalteromonas fenneropenaei TaxID=1737459 RepID=A0ABV7CLL8_9GAMM